MEGNITTACSIAFIKQHTKAFLTVSYILRKRKLSKKAEWKWFRYPSWKKKGKPVMLISVDVPHVFWNICVIWVYFEQKVTDKSEEVKHLFFCCTTNWSLTVCLQKADVCCTWNGAEQQHTTTVRQVRYHQTTLFHLWFITQLSHFFLALFMTKHCHTCKEKS